MDLFISKMTGKMEDFRALNTSPLTNDFCIKMAKTDTICKRCYSRSMLNSTRPLCRPVYARNGEILSKKVPQNNLPIIEDKYFRFSAHGELMNKKHLLNLYAIARKNPDTTFTLWTKRKDWVQKTIDKKPVNVILVYSILQVDTAKPKVPDSFDKVFSVYTAKFALDNKTNINCHGKCKDCLKCYANHKVKYVNEVIKNQQIKYREGLNEAKGRIN